MNNQETRDNQNAVFGQKYAFATVSLVLGIASFLSLLGLEKSILAIIFGWLALKPDPSPALAARRRWGKAGIVLGAAHFLLVVVVVVVGWRLIVPMLLFASDVAMSIKQGPKVVQSVSSPDGKFVAYAEEMPSFDPPNQALVVERADQRHFMPIAHLAEDVDSIQRIVWSPDSRIVVFQSRYYLTATRITDWQSVRVYLGKEWTRHQPKRQSTFSAGEPRHIVAAVEFPSPGTDRFSYKFQGDERQHTLSFSPTSP